MWIVENLDPNPKFARFIAEPGEVYKALASALEKGRYQLKPGFLDAENRKSAISERYWKRALADNSVSPHFEAWLFDLFPDLSSEQLRAHDLKTFLRLGEPTTSARRAWVAPALHYTNHRKALHAAAMLFYGAVQHHGLDDAFAIPFPLLIRPGWIRNAPLAMTEESERTHLKEPGPFRSYTPPKLTGLSGDYMTYRGKLGLPKRMAVRPEAQHNGEIFCAREVLQDGGGFVGFEYDLGLYFDYVNTSEVLGVELAAHLLEHSGDAADLPPRFKFRGAPQDAFNLCNRAAYPGVNCASVFLNYEEQGKLAKGHWFLLHKRDETQMQAQNSVHVVPAGGHQPLAKGALRDDTALWRTMVREFAEELFDKEKLSRQLETWSAFALHPDIRAIKETFFSGPNPAAKLYLHGFGLDPITLKPEVLCTLIIDWKHVGNANLKLKYNWELRTEKPGVTRHQWVELSKENLVREATQRRQSFGDRRLDALPAGAAALLLTAAHYEWLGLPEVAAL
jgi:hypothetical protein